MQAPPKHLTTFSLAMLNVATVLSLRAFPLLAATGYEMIFYCLFAAILFLLPVSFVAAEFATTWPGPGGVNHWVKEAFGARLGLCAVWLQWTQNLFWYPGILGFAAASLAYLLNRPSLATNNYYQFFMIVIIYWVAVIICSFGLKFISRIATWGVILGTFAPAILLIVLGFFWVLGHPQSALLVSHKLFFPNFSQLNQVAFLADIVLLFAGMEVGAVHVVELTNPHRQYPRAILYPAAIIVITFLLGSFAVFTIVPVSDLNLLAGTMQAFQRALVFFHCQWLIYVVSACVTFGVLASVLAWVVGPSKGLLATAKNGEIPPFLAHTNRHNIQINILIIQAIVVTVLASLYLILKNVDVAFILLSAISAALYLIMYFIMFISIIRLRFKAPHIKRPYAIPGGKVGLWFIAGIGVLASFFAIVLAFVPPAKLAVSAPMIYSIIVALAIITFCVAPFVIYACRKSSWSQHRDVKSD